MSEKQPLYLKHVVLEDYRSIQRAEIEFKPGLNIIIGKNGTGKTNFCKFLNSIMKNDFDETQRLSSAKVFFKGKHDYSASFSPASDNENAAERYDELDPLVKYTFDNEEWSQKDLFGNISTDWYDFMSFIHSIERVMPIGTMISHGIPPKLLMFNSPVTNSYTPKKRRDGLSGIFRTDLRRLFSIDSSTGVINSNFSVVLRSNIFKSEEDSINQSYFKSRISEVAQGLAEFLSKALRSVSSINNVRLSDSFDFTYLEESGELAIRNLFFEFQVNNRWHLFDELSDGTRRIVFMISELVSLSQFSGFYASVNIIEEPELGIHPHQLHKLMTFLKEQAETKQIIITTHSPQVLNILGRDDFDRIIICEYDVKKGTSLRHMTDEEKKNALIFMEDMYLSDYWLHSDFNRDKSEI